MDENEHVRKAIAKECDSIKEMLLAKNTAYGNSALNPIRVFAIDMGPMAQLRARIDDKLSRIAQGYRFWSSDAAEDTVADLIGYLVLFRIAEKEARGE